MTALKGSSIAPIYNGGTGTYVTALILGIELTMTGNTVSWYTNYTSSGREEWQMNGSGLLYNYFAIV